MNVFVLAILQGEGLTGSVVASAVTELEGEPIHFHPDPVVFSVGLLIGGSVREHIGEGSALWKRNVVVVNSVRHLGE